MPDTPADPLEELDSLLLGLPDDSMVLSDVDGLIAALLVVPGLSDRQWLPTLWGGGAAPLDPASVDRIDALIRARKAAVVGALLLGDLAYEPLFDIDPNDDVPLWECWIEGFGEGVALAEEGWATQIVQDDEDLAAAAMGLSMMIALAQDRRRNPDLARQAPDLIPYFVETLYRRQRGLPRVVLDATVASLPGLGSPFSP